MLAIFDGRVAKRPDCMKMPHKNAVSALKEDFLINHFTSLYPDSVVISSEAAFSFAYSLGASSSPHQERYHIAHTDGVFCLYQGFIKEIDVVKRDFNISEIDDEGIAMILVLQIFRQLGQRLIKNAVEHMFRNCISVFYDVPSKLIVLAGGSDHDLQIYWGIDARFNLVISSNEEVVDKACGSVQAFLRGHVYACCKGRTGQEALFLNNQPRYKVDFTDKYFPIHRPIEAISKMIVQADKDRSKPYAQKWEPPMPAFFKINTDAVKFKDGMLGIGWVIRNSEGVVQFAATRKTEITLPESDPVLHAFMEGFSLAVGFKLPRCICESVPLNLDKVDVSRVSEIIEIMVHKVGGSIEESICEFGVSFVSSSANKAAHRLALHAKTNDHIFWRKETPDFILALVESERPNIGTSTNMSSVLKELDI